MEDILSGLNEKQVEAVTAPDGPLLVLAGAGSGKTKTLTHRVAYLIKERGLEPGSILTVTFTNKAAEEMKGRIRALLGERIDPPLMGTFHSVCANFLRRDIDRLGWERNFSIIDAADQLSLIKSLMKELSFDPKQISPRAVIAGISRAKNSLVSPAVAAERADSHFEEIVAKIFAAYEARLRQIGALDFDDLLVMTVRLWQENEDVLHRYRERFSHILVDEYQDTNHIQYRLINLLAGERKNIFVIGDDYQSIYSFRAADIGNILNFRRDYPHSRVITLERNYRSSGNILAAASEVISRNRSQHHKKLRTDREAGEKITVCAAASEKDEAAFVAEEIDALRESGRSWGEITILYRANSQSRNLEEAFIRAGVPYRIVGGLKFYDRKEIKDMLAYLRLLVNPRDEISLRRVINAPARGLGEKTLNAWLSFAAVSGRDPIAAGLSFDRPETEIEGVSTARRRAVADFCRFLAETREKAAKLSLPEIIFDIYENSGYKRAVFENEDNFAAQSREDNIKELAASVSARREPALSSLAEFLERTALVSDTDELDRGEEAVRLMTLHSAKGLEFPVVFIVGLEEGLLPHSRSQTSAADLEEERRLMYVGMTRAMDKLYLVHARARTVFGSRQRNSPSRFLADLPEENCLFLERNRPESRFSQVFSDEGISSRKLRKSSSSESTSFSDGETVKHPLFGSGMIVAQDEHAYTIAFADGGIKKIAKAFEGLKKA